MAKPPPQVTVRDPLRKYLRPLTAAERSRLEASLLADGCRDPLVVWPHGGERVLVDGHHRYDLCQEHGLAFKTVDRDFADEEEVLLWMVLTHQGRRNAQDPEKHYYIGARYLREKRTHGGDRKSSCKPCNLISSDGLKTAERVAEAEGISPRTVHHHAKFAERVDELAAHLGDQVKWDILSGLLAFSPRLYRRLTETPPDEARAALAAARADAGDPEKKLTPAAIFEHLPAEVGPGVPEEDPSPFNAALFLAPLFDPISERALELPLDDLSTVVLVMRSYLSTLEGILRRKEAV
jgi:hypothetical protein